MQQVEVIKAESIVHHHVPSCSDFVLRNVVANRVSNGPARRGEADYVRQGQAGAHIAQEALVSDYF
eukprot:8924196-Ditylum_brightwellii.AAC.1